MKKLLSLGLMALSLPVAFTARAEDSVRVRISFNRADSVTEISSRLSYEARKLQNIVDRVLNAPGADYGKSRAERTDEVRAAMEAERFLTSVSRLTRLTSGRESVRSSYFSLPPMIQVMRENFNQLVWALDTERQGDTDIQAPGAVRVDVATILGRGRLNISIAVGEGPDAHRQVARILTNISNLISELEGCRGHIIEERRIYDAPQPPPVVIVQPPREFPPAGPGRPPRGGPGRGGDVDVDVNVNVNVPDNGRHLPANASPGYFEKFDEGGSAYGGRYSFVAKIKKALLKDGSGYELAVVETTRGGDRHIVSTNTVRAWNSGDKIKVEASGSLRRGQELYLLYTDTNDRQGVLKMPVRD